jgi:hypothetical protein
LVPRRLLDCCFENGIGCVGIWFLSLERFYNEREIIAR